MSELEGESVAIYNISRSKYVYLPTSLAPVGSRARARAVPGESPVGPQPRRCDVMFMTILLLCFLLVNIVCKISTKCYIFTSPNVTWRPTSGEDLETEIASTYLLAETRHVQREVPTQPCFCIRFSTELDRQAPQHAAENASTIEEQ